MAEAIPSDDNSPRGGKSMAELSKMLELRRQLAEAEIESDKETAKRLAIVGGAGLIAVLTGLPLLTSVLTARVDEALKLSFPWVSLTVALVVLVGGLLLAWSAWRRFHREFLGLRESLQELREDLIWLRERFGDGG